MPTKQTKKVVLIGWYMRIIDIKLGDEIVICGRFARVICVEHEYMFDRFDDDCIRVLLKWTYIDELFDRPWSFRVFWRDECFRDIEYYSSPKKNSREIEDDFEFENDDDE